MSVLGALRNLSYGRSNEDNKLEIAGEHGLSEIMLALRMSRVPEVSYVRVYVCMYVCVCVCGGVVGGGEAGGWMVWVHGCGVCMHYQ